MDLEGKRVTVGGAAGFIGTHLVNKLVESGAVVRGLVHKKSPQVELAGVDYLSADLTREADALRALRDTDVFVMAAANSSGAAVMEHRPLIHLTPNVVMNALTLDAAHQNGVQKYCFISSNTVYPPSDEPMAECDATGSFFDKYEVVGEMKWFSEKMVNFYATKVSKPMETLIVRPGNLYGPYDKFSLKESKVIPALIRRAVAREDPFVVWGDGSDIKDFLFISDFVEAFFLAMQKDLPYATVNIASGSSVNLLVIIEEILRLTGNEGATVEFDISKPAMIPKRLIDVRLMSSLLNWAPTVSLAEGLATTIQWFQSQEGISNEVE